MAETTTTQIADLPEYQKQYLQEIMQRAQALGKQAYTYLLIRRLVVHLYSSKLPT